GQIIGGGPLGTTATVTPGQGLQLNGNAAGMGLDEVAIYPAALSSQQVRNHFAAQYLTPPPVIAAPVNTAPPSISGVTTSGQTLTEVSGAWTGSPTSFGQQWQRCNSAGDACVAIAGATDPSYRLTSADVGKKIRVLVTAANSAGNAQALSAAAGPVAPSAKQIKAALAKLFGAKAKRARAGFVVTFASPSAGRLSIAWLRRSAGHKSKLVRVATGGRQVSRARTVKVRIRLTAKGRAALAHARRLRLTGRTRFTPTGGTAVVLVKTFTLRTS
ncbi:MAG: hypothetical protein QOG63_2155, partial [Thermoleophilaceae bacterium]|nr:hypothetical protein [Thermoleophilaceae bacterium]